jgi:3-dehydroquinate dehydratase-1
VEAPFFLRGIEYGGARPLFCIPLVANDRMPLLAQAKIALDLAPDLVEWRADFYKDATTAVLIDSSSQLRAILKDIPIIFTLRIKAEGGGQDIPQETRRAGIETIAASGFVDMIDVELCNGMPFLEPLMRVAREHDVRVILSFHDFDQTPANEELLGKIDLMCRRGADVAKIAVMPRTAGDVLRLLEITLEARKRFPRLPLCTMSMGRLGILSRIAGFLFGSDMAFAVGQETSAPGQIPIAEARALAETLLKLAGANS